MSTDRYTSPTSQRVVEVVALAKRADEHNYVMGEVWK